MRSLTVTLVKGHFYKMEVKTNKKKDGKLDLLCPMELNVGR